MSPSRMIFRPPTGGGVGGVGGVSCSEGGVGWGELGGLERGGGGHALGGERDERESGERPALQAREGRGASEGRCDSASGEGGVVLQLLQQAAATGAGEACCNSCDTSAGQPQQACCNTPLSARHSCNSCNSCDTSHACCNTPSSARLQGHPGGGSSRSAERCRKISARSISAATACEACNSELQSISAAPDPQSVTAPRSTAALYARIEREGHRRERARSVVEGGEEEDECLTANTSGLLGPLSKVERLIYGGHLNFTFPGGEGRGGRGGGGRMRKSGLTPCKVQVVENQKLVSN